jgi:hypothetical protein
MARPEAAARPEAGRRPRHNSAYRSWTSSFWRRLPPDSPLPPPDHGIFSNLKYIEAIFLISFLYGKKQQIHGDFSEICNKSSKSSF